ncbi:MAG: NAD(P)-dependent alcohol dehydrogenase, partial [Chloroflexi bacterium]
MSSTLAGAFVSRLVPSPTRLVISNSPIFTMVQPSSREGRRLRELWAGRAATPLDDEVPVRVRAVAVPRADVATRDANRNGGPAVMVISRLVSGVRGPRQPILGSEFAGEVAKVGAAVKEFQVGNTVFGSTGFRFGAYAEFVRVRESARIAPMPARLSFEQAASITDGGLNALWCLRLAKPRSGQSILVYGASGAIGTAGVQLAKHLGYHVTGVTSTKNVDLVRALGAETVIDYTRDDFTKNGRAYDVI